MTTYDLKELANLDIRDDATEDQKRILRENLNEWREILLQMKRDSDFQLASSKAESAEKRIVLDEYQFEEYEARRLRWKANNVRFKNGIENRLSEIRQLNLTDYKKAIINHRDKVLGSGDEWTEQFDEELWDTIK